MREEVEATEFRLGAVRVYCPECQEALPRPGGKKDAMWQLEDFDRVKKCRCGAKVRVGLPDEEDLRW